MVILRVLFIDRLLHGKYTSFLLIANLYCIFFCFSKLDNYIFVQEFFGRYLLISINDRFLRLKHRLYDSFYPIMTV